MNNENNNINNGQNNIPTINNSEPVLNSVPIPNQEPVIQPVAPQPVMQPVTQEPVIQPVTPQPVIQPVTVQTGNSTVNNGTVPTSNNKVDDKTNKDVKNYTPPSKFKVIVLIIFFIALVAFIIFLPDIYSMVKKYKSGGYNYQKEEVITTGKLICVLNTNTTTLDKDYELVFNFTDSKLKSEKFLITTRSDSTVNEDEMNKLADVCMKLKDEVEELDGVYVRCEYSDNKLVDTQSFDLEKVDADKLNAAFTEAGGVMPTYKLDQDIDGIEKNMKATGYTCERE